MSSRKRKHTRRGSPDYATGGNPRFSQPSSSNSLSVQAHEATIIRDRPDAILVLTARDHGGGKGGLVQWQGEGSKQEQEVWVDRYDARLLLSSLPNTSHRTGLYASSPSPTGWSDLPSDSEDTFFFDPEEVEDFQREKRRKLIDAGREERLRAMKESDPDPARDFEEDRELWGSDGEEPDEVQKTLMERTAKHILSSPNPGQLEMRILANHGSDARFAFLRGRWRNSWQSIKLASKAEKAQLEPKLGDAFKNTMGGLVAYEDSDNSEDSDDGQRTHGHDEQGERRALDIHDAEDKEKLARRVRAREWAKQRKEGKVGKT